MVGKGQLSFPGLPPKRASRDRLFFALRLPSQIAARTFFGAEKLHGDLNLSGRLISADRLHITLYAFEPRTGVPETLVEGLRKAASRLEASLFEVSFDTVVSFRHKPIRPPIVLRGQPEDLSELGALRRRLVNGLVAAGLADQRSQPFTPHVTLLYDDRIVAPTPIEPIRWMVRDFALIHSHVGRTRHDELGRWTLFG